MITEEAYRLNRMICESEEYRQYLQKKSAVQSNQELYQAMNAFRKRNLELQSYDDGVNRYKEIHDLALEYENVLKHPCVNEFLLAEQIFSRRMKEIYEILANNLELDYDFVE